MLSPCLQGGGQIMRFAETQNYAKIMRNYAKLCENYAKLRDQFQCKCAKGLGKNFKLRFPGECKKKPIQQKKRRQLVNKRGKPYETIKR